MCLLFKFARDWLCVLHSSIDSGVCVEATHPPPSSTEEEMSLALIRLQTLAAVITTNLQQEELTS